MHVINTCKVNMQHLSLGGCKTLTDSSVLLISNLCPKLRYLGISGCHLVTNFAIQEIANHCPLVTHLLIDGCKQFTDETLCHIVTKLIKLQVSKVIIIV
jgi:F-box/leucine-rich repeat protein 2/20